MALETKDSCRSIAMEFEVDLFVPKLRQTDGWLYSYKELKKDKIKRNLNKSRFSIDSETNLFVSDFILDSSHILGFRVYDVQMEFDTEYYLSQK